MDSIELRAKIVDRKNGKSTNPLKEAHGIANQLSAMLGFLESGNLGTYGKAYGCNDIEELLAAANALKQELLAELGEEQWNAYF